MKEILYLEVPTADIAAVRQWLQTDFQPGYGEKVLTTEGFRLKITNATTTAGAAISQNLPEELSVFTWSVQRTTYLKVFRWAEKPFPQEKEILQQLTKEIRSRFPHHYPEPPAIDLSQQSIFEALAPYYPLTVKYFQKMPNGEYDLKRAYWWEQRWRQGVRNPQQPRQVVFSRTGNWVRGRGDKGGGGDKGEGVENSSLSPLSPLSRSSPIYDLIYIGGALGVIHAAVMAKLGYKVLLVERMPFGRMNREWNISRDEIQSLLNLGLITPAELDTIIAREYKDGFNKFFDANNPRKLRSPVLHTPTVLNLGLDSEKLLQLCGQKLQAAGGQIWDETEFIRADINESQVVLKVKHLCSEIEKQVSGRLLVDAMGTASPIAWQLNGNRAFDSVCPTVGAVIESGFAPEVWDSELGDVLHSHGDISRGRQLIWELFPAAGDELTIYLFHYHEVNAQNPGSLLEMYEDFFTILPEYRRCDMDKLVWKKPTFGYIPGHFSTGSSDRQVAFDRLIAIGDAASLQSPLIFTGFGSLVRNLERLTKLLDIALKYDLLSFQHLNRIRAYQTNVSVTWLFSKGMMVPTGKFLPPQRVNAMLNTFFGLLAEEPLEVADNFIKDRCDWFTFNRLALKAAKKNPALLLWIWQLAGSKDLVRWLGSYLTFSRHALISTLLSAWFPQFLNQVGSWLEKRNPALWLRLQAINYAIATGKPRSASEFAETSPKAIVEKFSH
ncbi:flavin-dependent dehydrogenase [Nostoc linckia z18]|uniref:Flavin-dependent dehydrogenase n=2 Tax=Nostoc linckia TaxID=92942 RepID=A0A9Q6EIA4_NOSLI|nr:flavin-dependent dehydrogenase [Nostoc linckia]PHK27716.1 flavin-dependent dehydrogenase [Nostoc linckia z15]PHK39764.1 flavin-dependent dehydrogenase [Nostoc linckia z16]PHJ56533.1 flavin-dependent dehydrogenase [Nostoc linckia z1]PHJ58499.1 flavin-dependent dehydrogenase [Nostoc linckia z3]PHJ61520.1 flavin-dependent dehydrogenase [Nostoc linckia z2]